LDPETKDLDRRVAAKGFASVVLSVIFLVLLSTPLGILPPIGGLANPGGGIWAIAVDAEHPTFQELTFSGLDGTVTVYRDPYGIPHVFAATEHDLFFAQGFVHAQDRMWQMDFMRRVARGELSEILGAKVGTLDVVEVDAFIRAIGLPSLARSSWANTTAADTSYVPLRSYAEGVNAFLRNVGTPGLALEFKLLNYGPRDWNPEDSLAIGLFMAWSLSGSFEDAELAALAQALGMPAVDELFPILGPYQRPVDPRPGTRGGDAGFTPGIREAARDLLRKEDALAALTGLRGPWLGSNNWAVNGSRTDTNRPRLANDPHLSLQMPAIWYENQLVGAGFDVYGVSIPGIPAVILGQTRHHAWGFTNVGADVVDLYSETVSGDDYFFEGAWRPLERRAEVIRVKGGNPVTVTVSSTVHGPIITTEGQAFAMRWTARDAANLLAAVLGMNTAAMWTEFREALRDWGVPAQNVVYADEDRIIAMRSNGLYPIRAGGGDEGRFPMDGASGTHEWVGFVPFDEQPESVNPIEDFVLSANQQPQDDAYPYYVGSSWDPGYRARRINEMLENDTSVTAADLQRMQLDTLDVMAREFVPFIEDAVMYCANPPCTPTVMPDELAALLAWDFRMDADKAAPAIWWRFANHLREEIFGDEWEAAGVADLSLPLPNMMEYLLKEDNASAWFDDVRTPTIRETWRDTVVRAFGFASSDLRSELGPDVATWRWGDVHARVFPHLTQLDALSRGPFPSGGDSLTVNVAPGDLASAGPSWRLLADLHDPTESKGVYPGGQSGNPLSRHYDDLLDLYLAGEYHGFALPATVADMRPAWIESTLILRRT